MGFFACSTMNFGLLVSGKAWIFGVSEAVVFGVSVVCRFLGTCCSSTILVGRKEDDPKILGSCEKERGCD